MNIYSDSLQTIQIKNIMSSITSAFKNAVDYVLGLFPAPYNYIVLCGGILVIIFLILFIIHLICKNGTRKKRHYKKIINCKKKIDELNDQIQKMQSVVSEIELREKDLQTEADKSIEDLLNHERLIIENENMLNTVRRNKIHNIELRQKELTELLKKQQSGIFKSMRKEKAESTKLELDDLLNEQCNYERDLYVGKNDTQRRTDQLSDDIARINKELEENKNKLAYEKIEIHKKINSLIDERNELQLYLNNNITPKEAKNLEQLAHKDDALNSKIKEQQALEELKKAKLEYEIACKNREKAEANKAIAIENAKAEYREKRALEQQKKAQEKAQEKAKSLERLNDGEQQKDEVKVIIANKYGEIPLTQNSSEPEQQEELPTQQDNVPQEEQAEYSQLELLDNDEVVFTEVKMDDLDEVAYTETDEISDGQTVMTFDDNDGKTVEISGKIYNEDNADNGEDNKNV